MKSPVCKKHGSVMTFGRSSKRIIFQDAHIIHDGQFYYCNECVDELQAEYERYRQQYKPAINAFQWVISLRKW